MSFYPRPIHSSSLFSPPPDYNRLVQTEDRFLKLLTTHFHVLQKRAFLLLPRGPQSLVQGCYLLQGELDAVVGDCNVLICWKEKRRKQSEKKWVSGETQEQHVSREMEE